MNLVYSESPQRYHRNNNMSALLTQRDEHLVTRELHSISPNWREIGTRLGLPQSVLHDIDMDYYTPERKLAAIVRVWLVGGGREVTWGSLVRVLRSTNHSALAERLEAVYGSSSSESEGGNGEKPRLSQLVPIPLTGSQRRQLGLHLKIPESELRRMEKEGNENKQKRVLFKTWLEGRGGGVSWNALLEALGRVDSGLKERVRTIYQDQQPQRQKPATTEHDVNEKDSPQSSGSRPVTMPLTSRQSPDSHIRSSSSSYHSASNYDEPEDNSIPPYPSNVDPPLPRSLVKPVAKLTSSLSSHPHTFTQSPADSGVHSRADSGNFAPRKPATSFRAPEIRPRSAARVGGAGSPDEGLVREFREAVRVWSCEGVEKVLVQDRGVNVDMIIRDKDGRTALMLAAAADQPPMVRSLLKYRASPHTTDKNGCTALYLACSHGNYEVMKLLVEEFADVNARAGDGTPMLLVPAQKGFSMVTQYLLENGADPNLTDRAGVTPVMVASRRGQRDVVKVLLSHGADVSMVGLKSSRTALQEAIDIDHKEIITLLIDATRRAEEKNQRLFTCKSAEEARELVRDNARLDDRRGDKATPLIVQVERGNEEVVKELLQLGANVDLQDSEGETALMKACSRGYYSIVVVIISYRAILDLKSKGGDTALMYAVKEDQVVIVKELLMSGADPTIRNKNGQTALELAEEMGSRDMVEEIKKHTSIADSKDPFINLLSGYLEKATMKSDHVKVTGREVVRFEGASRGSHKTTTVRGGGGGRKGTEEEEEEERSPLREQLSKAWKRIADLETRVHDLTLQTTLEISEETDLTFYDRKRLETEFKKLKELKHKAEQYAVEAKQTAQRLSAENFKLKEDLSREQHFNELERKNILREMEARMTQRRGEEEREQAKKEVVEQTITERAQELATTMKVSTRDVKASVEISYEMIKDLILNQRVTVNLALFIVAGLPFSGKSTVLRRLVSCSAPASQQEMHGLGELEAVVLKHDIRNISHWSVFEHQQVLLVAITLIQVALKNHPFPKFPHSQTQSKNLNIFGHQELDKCFTNLFRKFPVEMMNMEETRSMLTTGDVSFVTAWDIGMNKAVFDIMVMIAPECENAILLDFFNVNRDADTIDEIPNLGDEQYEGRYRVRNDAKELLRLRSKLEYLYYPMFVLENQSCVLVGTHRDVSEGEVREKSTRVLRRVETQFHTQEHTHLSLPQLVTVGHDSREDIRTLRHRLEETISTNPVQFQVQLPVKWGFLRTFLAHTKRLYIPLPQLKALAKPLHITNSEVMEFVKLFSKTGSLIHVKGLCPECADEFVIVRPAEFLKEVEKLYYIQENPDVSQDLKERAKFGYISRKLADALWIQSPSDSLQRSGFFIHALRRMGILIALNHRDKKSEEEYFMPRIRPRACNERPVQGSLFLSHGTVFPLPLQSQFLIHFHNVLHTEFEFDPMDCLNTLHFRARDGGHDLTLRFMNSYVEVHGTGFSGEQHSTIKTACIEVMVAIQRQRPKLKLKYSLGILCPNWELDGRKPHFAEFHPLEEGREEVFCAQCVGMVGVDRGSREWMEASYTGPLSLVQFEGDIVSKAEIFAIADSLSTLSLEKLTVFVRGLGLSGDQLTERMKHATQHLVIAEVLLEFSDRTDCHVRRRLGQILLNNGHWREALKIYPLALKTCIYSNSSETKTTPTISDSTSLSLLPLSKPRPQPHPLPMYGFTVAPDDDLEPRELRLVAMHLSRWEEVGMKLGLDQETLDQCKKSNRTTFEMAHQMLLKWHEESEQPAHQKGSRERLIQVLHELKCDSVAAFLRFGETDHYSK